MRDGWTETTLGDIAEYINGYPFKPSDLGDEGTAVIRIKQLLDPMEKVDRTTVDVPERCVLSNGDIVFSWSGTLAVRVWNRGTAFLNQHLFRVVEKSGISHEWLPLVIDHAIDDLVEKSHGTTMKHITKQTLLPHQVLLPPLMEQKRIVDVMSSVDAYIDALQQRAETARTARNAVLHELLSTGGDDWTATTLGEVVVINPEAARGMADDDKIVYVDLSSVSAESGISSDLYRGSFGEAPGRARRVIRTQDVLVSTVRPYLRGFALVPDFLDGEIASTGFAVLRAKPSRVLPGLVWAIVGTNNFVDYLMDRATGSSYPAVRPEDIASFNFSLPPLEEQKRIVEIVSSMDEVIRSTEQAVSDAKSLRSGLLSDLLSGEHEIPASYDSLLGAA